MFARVTTSGVAPERAEESKRFVEQAMAAMKGLKGFRGFYHLDDFEAGKGMAISLWETEEDARAVGAALARLHTSLTQDLGAVVPQTKYFEVTAQT